MTSRVPVLKANSGKRISNSCTSTTMKTKDLSAELVIYHHNGMFDFNAAYVRDGGIPNDGWESLGIFPSVHDALIEGKEWFEEAKKQGCKRGAYTIPWRKAAA